MSKNASAAAFGHGNPEQGGDPGLTKRELFAAMAMQGQLTAGYRTYKQIAEESVAYAEALIAALSKEQPDAKE